MVFTVNNTLRELVDETTLIKEDAINNRDTLIATLENKGIEITEVSKLPDLIDKVNEIEVEKHDIPDWLTFHNRYFEANNYIKRRYAANGTVGKFIYVLGGHGGTTGVLSRVDCYNTNENTWTTKTKMPEARTQAGSATINENIYVLGGTNSSNDFMSSNYCYNTKTDTWTTKTETPITKPIYVNAVNNNIYLIDASIETGTKTNWQYNTKTDTWTSKTEMPVVRGVGNSAAINENIYIMGGKYGSGNSNYYSNYCYNALTDTWTQKRDTPKWMGQSLNVVSDKCIYVIGGYYYNSGNYYQSYNYCYNSLVDTWENNAPLQKARADSSGGVVGSHIYIIGGSENTTVLLDDTLVYLI